MAPLTRYERNLGELDRAFSIVCGAALLVLALMTRRKPGWIASPLGAALLARGLTGNCKLYQACAISTAPQRKARISVPGNRGIKVERSIVVHRAPEEVYKAWRNFENLPHFMEHLSSVTEIDSTHSRWVARGPAGRRIEWDAEVINEDENEMIAWRSLEGSQVASAGSVRFAPVEGGGTEVRVSLEYDPPGGVIGAAFARLFHQEPSQQISEDMRRFKQMMEIAG